MTADANMLRRRTRCLLILFLIGLVLSGLTAFPIPGEVAILQKVFGEGSAMQPAWPRVAS